MCEARVRAARPSAVDLLKARTMESVLRALNVLSGPPLTLLMASRLQGLTIGGRDAAEVVAGVVVGLLLLVFEIVLRQGPKRNVRLRRWLDPRANFEGFWLQEVFEAHENNTIGLFSSDYDADSNSFAVSGHAYDSAARRWSKWKSPHVFIDRQGRNATYQWKGELVGKPTPDDQRAGITELELRPAPAFQLPLTGEGRVWHLGEDSRLKFKLRRVTNVLLRELGLSYTVRELRLNDHDEETQLVRALLRSITPATPVSVP